MTASDPRLILALDEPNLTEARALVETLGPWVSAYKIGLTLLAQGGVELAAELRSKGKYVFQDWKLHDIGAQVEGAAKAICHGDCDLLTVHAEPQVMRAAVAAKGRSNTQIIGVTVMTSLNQDDLTEMGYGHLIEDLVKRRVDQALDCGLDGVVASPLEAGLIRARVPKSFLIVTPGVRPLGASVDDQQRMATPSMALASGASHLVIGRPITRASDPVAATQAILEEIKGI